MTREHLSARRLGESQGRPTPPAAQLVSRSPAGDYGMRRDPQDSGGATTLEGPTREPEPEEDQKLTPSSSTMYERAYLALQLRPSSEAANQQGAGSSYESLVDLSRPSSPPGFVQARLTVGRPGESGGAEPLATTRDGRTQSSSMVANHPERRRIAAHESVHRAQFASRAPLGTRPQLEADAQRGAQILLDGGQYAPTVAAPSGMTLAFGGVEDWFPNLEDVGRTEQRAVEGSGLADSVEARGGIMTEETPLGGGARARYEINVSASGQGGSIQSHTTVTLDYEPNRRVTVVGPPVIQINPEMGLGPTDDRPAYPYTLSYSRTITYTDRNGRSATVEVDGHVFASEATFQAAAMAATPSYDALLGLLGDSGYVSASLRGSGPITGYFASYAGAGDSLSVQVAGAVAGLGRRGGLSLIEASAPATFVDPRLSAGAQHDSLRAYLISADVAEVMRRLATPPASEPSWFDDLTQSLADAVGSILAPIIDAADAVVAAVQEVWNDLPPWARGVLTAVGKFAVALGAMAAVAGAIVLATKGAIAFGIAMVIVGAAALAIGFVTSFGRRLVEAWNSDSRLRLLQVPTIALLDAVGLSGIIEGITDRSMLTGEPLERSEEERWEAGTTGALQLVGIFLMARGLRGGGSGGRTVTPEVRGNLGDFHALPVERLPVLPEGHYWARQGSEWVMFREPGAPEVPIEVSIYSDGQGNINYNIRTGNRVLQSEVMTRPTGDTYQGGENRLPPELRGVGEDNPFIEEGTGRLFDKGHGIDYVERIEGPNVRSSNADAINFTPQARYWNSFLRNHLVGAIRARGGGYREMPIYGQNPSSTVNQTPIPAEFIFVETSPTGQAVAAWRIPNDPAIATRQMAQLPQYSIPLSQVPAVMVGPGGQVQPPGTMVGPVIITGARGEQEQSDDSRIPPP